MVYDNIGDSAEERTHSDLQVGHNLGVVSTVVGKQLSRPWVVVFQEFKPVAATLFTLR